VALLNDYLTRMSGVIERNHGIVDKFLGDGIMALFGAPAVEEDDAGNALQAALEMIAELERLNLELSARALPRLDSGIGINTAQVVAGNMGSPNRLNYTVIGDGVNLAARIEGLTKRGEFRTHIILTEATVRAAKRSFATRSLGMVAVRGKRDPVALYALDETGRERS
jgi:adenylate cyclase